MLDLKVVEPLRYLGQQEAIANTSLCMRIGCCVRRYSDLLPHIEKLCQYSEEAFFHSAT